MVPGTRRIVLTPENSQAGGRDRHVHKSAKRPVKMLQRGWVLGSLEDGVCLTVSGQEAWLKRDSCPGLEG